MKLVIIVFCVMLILLSGCSKELDLGQQIDPGWTEDSLTTTHELNILSDIQYDTYDGQYMLFYKGVPLWEVTNSETKYEQFWLEGGSISDPTFYLLARDESGTLNRIGGWETLDEALEWVNNPVSLHD